MVTVEVQTDDCGGQLAFLQLGDVQQHQRIGGTVTGGDGDLDLLADSGAFQNAVFVQHFKGSQIAILGHEAVDMFLKQLQDLSAAGFKLLGGGNGGAVSHGQGVGQGGIIPVAA